jgi:hypothetical protein
MKQQLEEWQLFRFKCFPLKKRTQYKVGGVTGELAFLHFSEPRDAF